MHKHTRRGVQSLNNLSYEGGGLNAWRAHNIGPGKFCSAGTIGYSTGSNKSYHYTRPNGSGNLDSGETSTTISCWIQPLSARSHHPVWRGRRWKHGPTRHEEWCINVFQSFAALQRHLDVGKHLIRLECETQYAQIGRKWAETCQSLVGGYLQSVPFTFPRLQPLPTNLTIKTYLLQRKDGLLKMSEML